MEAKNAEKVSIIIPTFNEEGNIQKLVKRIDNALKKGSIEYEIIIIDDHSTDNTVKMVNDLSDEYPISCHLKKGNKGKAFSILEGFEYAKHDTLAMIDADLQYPPEAIPEMVRKITDGAGVVVANRRYKDVSPFRKLASKGFNFVFGQMLHGLKCDVQSGLKVFKKQITKEITVDPSQWTFDLEFLVNARYAGHEIATVNIDFEKRHSGESKINVIKASWEIGTNALANKLKKRKPIQIASQDEFSMINAGLAHKGRRFITHSTLDSETSAIITFTASQKFLIFLAVILAVAGFLFFPLYSAIVLIAVLSSLYFFDVLFNLFLITKSLHNPPELNFTDEELSQIDESSLPVYAILCPLYRESAVLPKFLNSISKLEWPKDKLDVQLLLEENDLETIDTARSIDLPDYVRIVIVPHSLPKTKPKACNYGLNSAKGEYLVVYDAEDMPEPQQLKKAYLAFQRVPEKVKCLQAKLNYYNTNQNLLTRLFTAEYSLWFEIILPGLQSINTSIPLGGTSNHFRTADLRNLKGWDPFNVTEDADLGVRLFKQGFNTAIIDSITLEEANSQVWNWIRQRSRWIKGYMQTYLVHMRKPMEFLKKSGIHTFLFQLNVGGKIAFMLINPILWFMTISYFALRPIVGPTIESIYPTPVFYIAVFSLVFGNFLYFYYYMIGCAKRGHWPIIKYVFLIPFYWFFMSLAAVMATYQLFIKPHFWEKTKHGLHLEKAIKPS
ncbi:MAG: glycosyltransferase, partial [Patescibacteria group bacterium]